MSNARLDATAAANTQRNVHRVSPTARTSPTHPRYTVVDGWVRDALGQHDFKISEALRDNGRPHFELIDGMNLPQDLLAFIASYWGPRLRRQRGTETHARSRPLPQPPQPYLSTLAEPDAVQSTRTRNSRVFHHTPMANNADISQPRITSSGTYNASQRRPVPQELTQVLPSSQPSSNTPAGYSQQSSTDTSHRREQGGTNAQLTGNFGAPRATHATHPHHTSTQQQAMRQAPRRVNDHSSRSRNSAHVPASETREPSASLAVPDIPLQIPHVATERLSPVHTAQSPFEHPSSNADQPYTLSAAQNGVLQPQSLSHGMSSTSPMRQQADRLAFQPTDPVFNPMPSPTQPEMREISPMNLLSQTPATSRHSPFHFRDLVASSGDDGMEWPLLTDESHDEQQTGQPVGTSTGQANSRQHNMGMNNRTPIQHSCPTALPQSSSLPSAETGDEHHSASPISHDTAAPPTVSAAIETPRPRRPAREVSDHELNLYQHRFSPLFQQPLDILDESEDNMIRRAIDGIAIAKADNTALCQLFSSLNHFSTEVRYDDQISVCNNIQEVLERAGRVIHSKIHSLHWSHRHIAGNKQSPWYINFAGRVQEFIITLQKPQEIGRRPYNLKDLNVSTTALVNLYDLLADMELIVGNISASLRKAQSFGARNSVFSSY